MTLNQILTCLDDFLQGIQDEEQKTEVLNVLRQSLHRHSPFADEPVDLVLWLKTDRLVASDYNPNVMAPQEKRLLQHSLETDGFTQPVVATPTGKSYMVVDGFHRHRMGQKPALRGRLKGYLPVTLVNESQRGEAARMATTVRHNRARGQHQITAMSDIVRDLCRLGWDDARIGKELGMDADEVLRLKQISGLAELFTDTEFSEAWTVR